MKHTAMIALAVLVMAAGCTQTDKGGPQFGDNPPGVISEAPLLREARLAKARGEQGGGPMPNLIPTPVIEPFGGNAAPVVITGNAPMTTINKDAFGGTRVVNFGFPTYAPYRPPVAPYPYYGY